MTSESSQYILNQLERTPHSETPLPREEKDADYYRESVIRHVIRRSKLPMIQLDKNGVVTLYLTTATDDDVKYWRTKFRDCRRIGTSKIEFKT